MRDLRTLKELSTIRLHRLDAAQKAVQEALKNVELALQKELLSKETLEEYQVRMPQLIEALYSECIGLPIGKDGIAQIHHKELKLLSKRDEYRHDYEQCQDQVKSCHEVLAHKKESLKKEQLKYDGLQTLVKQETRKYRITQERHANKMMDEFAITCFNV